jgi:hypothetical protein
VTRDDAKKIMENLAIISHYAAGGKIEHPLINCHGEFVNWYAARSLNLHSMGHYRIVGAPLKARVKVNICQPPGAPHYGLVDK